MQSFILAGEKIKFYHCIKEMCHYIHYTDAWRDKFWEDLLEEPAIYNELLYYLEHQDFLNQCRIDGYTILDVFVWKMREYNIRVDRGRNGPDCDKTAMLLETFRSMLDMKKNGSKIEWAMETRNGMDEL